MLWTDRSPRLRSAALSGVALIASMASPAMAADRPSARLVSCGSESCLLVSGRRADAASEVRINGRAVAVEGARKWRVRVPMEKLRAWSVPFERTITVTVAGVPVEAELPIGLLGHSENLAQLTVRAK